MVVLLICLDIKSEDVIVDFPNHKSWKGILSEMELVNYSGQLLKDFFFPELVFVCHQHAIKILRLSVFLQTLTFQDPPRLRGCDCGRLCLPFAFVNEFCSLKLGYVFICEFVVM